MRHGARAAIARYSWSMMFFDLPTPAEASVSISKTVPGLRAGGQPVSIRINCGAGFLGIMR
jgi:hypothetical protein